MTRPCCTRASTSSAVAGTHSKICASGSARSQGHTDKLVNRATVVHAVRSEQRFSSCTVSQHQVQDMILPCARHSLSALADDKSSGPTASRLFLHASNTLRKPVITLKQDDAEITVLRHHIRYVLVKIAHADEHDKALHTECCSPLAA